MPHSHDMVHVEGKGVHGSLPPPRHMAGFSRQRHPSSSCKHLKKDGIKKVAEEGPGGSNTGFIRPFPGRRITLLWLHAFGFMDYEGKEPRGSRCKVTGVCLIGPLALVKQDLCAAGLRVKRPNMLIFCSRAGSPRPRALRQFEGCSGKSEAMTTADTLISCRALQQVSHSGVTSLCMWSSEGHFKQEKGVLPSGLLPWGGLRRGWKWAREVIVGQKEMR